MSQTPDTLSDRELRILEAVVQTFIETAEPAGSQTIASRSGLGVSPATIRSTMSELEEKGLLYHPHTSAGRIPTDRAYRLYVDHLIRPAPVRPDTRSALAQELPARSAIDDLLRRAAEVLGVLTQELGVAAAPAVEGAVLERLDLVQVASDRLLLVFNLRSGVVRTIFVQARATLALAVVEQVARILNERLAGLTLREIRASLAARLRDTAPPGEGRDLLNIFIEEGDGIFALEQATDAVVVGSARALADQPEFASNEGMRGLLALTDQRDLIRRALTARSHGLTVTIGAEHGDPQLAGFTLVTSTYHLGDLEGVIGVLGPTRMPYDKVIGLVQHTSRLVEGLLQ